MPLINRCKCGRWKCINHNYMWTGSDGDNCNGGNNYYQCSVCGESYSEYYYPTHNPEPYGYPMVEATCTSDGVWAYQCMDCGVVAGTYPTPALGHDPIEDPGNLGHYYCSRCGEQLS